MVCLALALLFLNDSCVCVSVDGHACALVYVCALKMMINQWH